MAQSVVKVNVPAFSGPCWKLGGGNLLHLSGDVGFAGLWPCFSQFGSDHLRPSQLTWRPLRSAQDKIWDGALHVTHICWEVFSRCLGTF